MSSSGSKVCCLESGIQSPRCSVKSLALSVLYLRSRVCFLLWGPALDPGSRVCCLVQVPWSVVRFGVQVPESSPVISVLSLSLASDVKRWSLAPLKHQQDLQVEVQVKMDSLCSANSSSMIQHGCENSKAVNQFSSASG